MRTILVPSLIINLLISHCLPSSPVVLLLGPKQGFLPFAMVSELKKTGSLCSLTPTDYLKVPVLIVRQANMSSVAHVLPKVGRVEESQSLHLKTPFLSHVRTHVDEISIYSAELLQLSNHGNMGFSECSFQTNSISITWELVTTAIFGPYPIPTESRTLDVGPRTLCCKESSK